MQRNIIWQRSQGNGMRELVLFSRQLALGTRPEWQLGARGRLVKFWKNCRLSGSSMHMCVSNTEIKTREPTRKSMWEILHVSPQWNLLEQTCYGYPASITCVSQNIESTVNLRFHRGICNYDHGVSYSTPKGTLSVSEFIFIRLLNTVWI